MGARKGMGQNQKPDFKFTEGFIQEALEGFFAENSVKYFMDNLYVFGWESDKLIETKTGYIYEFEIKVSRSDFKNDFKNKSEKHMILAGSKACGQLYLPSFVEDWEKAKERTAKDGYNRRLIYYEEHKDKFLIDERRKPNVFYYAVPENLIPVEDIPEYAGLIYVLEKGSLQIVKKAPYIHKDKYNDAQLKLGEKFYFHMVDWKRRFWRERKAHDRIAKKLQAEIYTRGQEKPYADMQEERDRYRGYYYEKLGELTRMEGERDKSFWHNRELKHALANIIRKYEPDFNLQKFENEICEKEIH